MQSPEQKMSDRCMGEIVEQHELFLTEHAALVFSGSFTFWIFPPRIQTIQRPHPTEWNLISQNNELGGGTISEITWGVQRFQEFSQLIALVPPGVSFEDLDFVKRNYPHRLCIVRIEV